ncbi:hypothetical protein ACRRGR_000397 [Vibrio alginolyticus]|uniref:hypothetical protein n=1 Tax=Vibrio TaxID=662 RepID=UPI0011214B55|nr:MULTISPECIES: hypothetical protein [Vibrio]MDW1540417.1 hypothetical protein [Vibrio sp. YT-17]TOH53256.1 hypothetical protein CGI78_22720 [Vibrio parahaemolyticus]
MDITSDLICTYLSQCHVLPVQQIVNAKLIVNSKDEPTHVQGWCSITSSPRTLRVDHILDIYEPLSEVKTFFKEAKAKLEESGFEFDAPKSNRLSSSNTMDVCFTGFAKDEKSELMSKAESKESMVRQSVTRHLDMLCYGCITSPKKLEKALAQRVMFLNRHQFENLLETDEVPEEV